MSRDLKKKMVFLTGPRQVGKITLSRFLLDQAGGQYLNDDVAEDRASCWRRQYCDGLVQLLA